MPHFVTLIRYTQQGIAKPRKALRDWMPQKTLPKGLAANSGVVLDHGAV